MEVLTGPGADGLLGPPYGVLLRLPKDANPGNRLCRSSEFVHLGNGEFPVLSRNRCSQTWSEEAFRRANLICGSPFGVDHPQSAVLCAAAEFESVNGRIFTRVKSASTFRPIDRRNGVYFRPSSCGDGLNIAHIQLDAVDKEPVECFVVTSYPSYDIPVATGDSDSESSGESTTLTMSLGAPSEPTDDSTEIIARTTDLLTSNTANGTVLGAACEVDSETSDSNVDRTATVDSPVNATGSQVKPKYTHPAIRTVKSVGRSILKAHALLRMQFGSTSKLAGTPPSDNCEPSANVDSDNFLMGRRSTVSSCVRTTDSQDTDASITASSRSKSDSSVVVDGLDHEEFVQRKICRIRNLRNSLALPIHPKVKSCGEQSNSQKGNYYEVVMRPNDNNGFGFTIKGGRDQHFPICISKLNRSIDHPECMDLNDQIVEIDGKSTTGLTHGEAVAAIQAKRNGMLILKLRKPLTETDVVPNRDVRGTPDGTERNQLETSMEQLFYMSKETARVFVGIPRYFDLAAEAASDAKNVARNRYRDISPYDKTRVILKGDQDYINASHVVMAIPGSGVINSYVAAQGPLPHTCQDFWQMVWEQESELVVMLTSTIECRASKCHKYWPNVDAVFEMPQYSVKTLSETFNSSENPFYCTRELFLTNLSENSERKITQLQYLTWPDHGIPSDPHDFLQFVLTVRNLRKGVTKSTIVHCSAGIGRTGVLILMETSMCLIEAGQPVDPVSILKHMREQRPLLIQTSEQFKFVCQAICHVYKVKQVQPL